MVKSAEEIWQDALDSREQGDFVSAIDYAKEVVKIEEDNAEAWMAIATWSLPPPTRGKPSQPTLQQSSKSISALRKVVLHEPDNLDAWFMGGRILLDHLGMLEDAIQWWEDCRVHYPEKVTPIIEQIGILVRLGFYEECTDRLAELQKEKM